LLYKSESAKMRIFIQDKQLKEDKEIFKCILDNLPDTVLVFDDLGNNVYCADKIFGLSEDNISETRAFLKKCKKLKKRMGAKLQTVKLRKTTELASGLSDPVRIKGQYHLHCLVSKTNREWNCKDF